MKTPRWIVPLFVVSALYDGMLGFLFALAPGYPYQLFGVTPPNHMGYVRFPACLLLIFGLAMMLGKPRTPLFQMAGIGLHPLQLLGASINGKSCPRTLCRKAT